MSIEQYELDKDDEHELARRRLQVEEEYTKKITFLHNIYERSDMRCDVAFVYSDIVKLDSKNSGNFTPNIFVQIRVLLVRGLKNILGFHRRAT